MTTDDKLIRGGEVVDGTGRERFRADVRVRGGRIAERGTVIEGAIADLVVFALDELHYDDDVFVDDLPGGGARLRRPEGGYRATLVAGEAVQLGGQLTGALPGRVIGLGGDAR